MPTSRYTTPTQADTDVICGCGCCTTADVRNLTGCWSDMRPARTRQAKPTVRLRRPTCTELCERPDLVAQLVLDVSAA